MPQIRSGRILAWLLLCLASTAADARHHAPARSAGGAPAVAGQFDYYLLALSWSPSYCLTHQADRTQCRRGYGFVLHGLWPQYSGGGYPEDCRPAPPPSAAAALKGQTLYPSVRLMQHEWLSHGSCSGQDAMGYFDKADQALAVVVIPPVFEAPRERLSMSPAQVLARFHAANPRLPGDGVALRCARHELAEVRVCLGKDLAFRACGRGVRSNCPGATVHMPAVR